MRRVINTLTGLLIFICFFLPSNSYAGDTALRNSLASRESVNRFNVAALVAAPGSIENEEEIIRRVREAILIDNTAFAVDAIVLILGKRGMEFDKKLIKAIDKAHRDKYEPSGFILEDINWHERVMGKFSAKLIKKAQHDDNRDFIYAWLTVYLELNEIKGGENDYQIKTVKDILVILEHILENRDESQSKDIVDRFIPFIVETFPKVALYWETYPYNKELVNLFSTFASLYPDHSLLIQACRKFVGLEECIRKEMYSRARWALPRKIVYALTAGRTGRPVPAQQLIRFRVTPDSGIVGVTPDTIAISRMINGIDDEAKRREMEKEIKIFTKTWKDFISLLIVSFRALRDTALKSYNLHYHYEMFETPDAYILFLAQKYGLIMEESERVFIRTPLGIDIPLRRKQYHAELETTSGERFVSPYSVDLPGAVRVFRDRLFFGLRIDRREDTNAGLSMIRWDNLVLAMIRPGFRAAMNKVRNQRDALMDSAVRLESIDTGLSEERIKETYDMAELVRKWLDKLGIMNIDIQTQCPFSTLQMLPPASPAIQHTL